MDTQEYTFTQDWFHWAPALWEQFIPILPGRWRMLEIGAYEGRSMVWIVENMLIDHGTLVSIDTWGGGEEHADHDMRAVEVRYDANKNILKDKFPNRHVTKIKNPSSRALAALTNEPAFDFAYIDGSHTAPDVLTDACMVWPLMRTGGIVVFDDYLWGEVGNILHRPKLAVDAFLNIFAEQVQILHLGEQVAIVKK